MVGASCRRKGYGGNRNPTTPVNGYDGKDEVMRSFCLRYPVVLIPLLVGYLFAAFFALVGGVYAGFALAELTGSGVLFMICGFAGMGVGVVLAIDLFTLHYTVVKNALEEECGRWAVLAMLQLFGSVIFMFALAHFAIHQVSHYTAYENMEKGWSRGIVTPYDRTEVFLDTLDYSTATFTLQNTQIVPKSPAARVATRLEGVTAFVLIVVILAVVTNRAAERGRRKTRPMDDGAPVA
jgi:hypothetical protein